MSNAQEFKNQDIIALVERSPGCKVDIAIEATSAMAEKSFAKATKNITKEVSIPGFRKGKAPEKMILNKYSKDIDREFKELLVNDAINQTLHLCQLYPWNRSEKINLNVVELSREKGGKFKISFECLPSVPTIQAQDLSFKRLESEPVTAEAVENHLEEISYNHAEWTEITDRAVQDRDFVDVIKTTQDKEDAPETIRVMLKKGKTDEEIYKKLIGLNIGDTCTLNPRLASEEEKELIETNDLPKINLKVEKIFTAKLPEFDEKFLAHYGAKDLEDLKSKVQKYLEGKAIQQKQSQERHEMEGLLLEKYKFEVPASMREREEKNTLQNLKEMLAESHVNEEKVGEMATKLQAEARKKAEDNIRLQYLLVKFIGDRHIQVTEEEVTLEILRRAIRPDGTIDVKHAHTDDKNLRGAVQHHLSLLKALDYLVQHAK